MHVSVVAFCVGSVYKGLATVCINTRACTGFRRSQFSRNIICVRYLAHRRPDTRIEDRYERRDIEQSPILSSNSFLDLFFKIRLPPLLLKLMLYDLNCKIKLEFKLLPRWIGLTGSEKYMRHAAIGDDFTIIFSMNLVRDCE